MGGSSAVNATLGEVIIAKAISKEILPHGYLILGTFLCIILWFTYGYVVASKISRRSLSSIFGGDFARRSDQAMKKKGGKDAVGSFIKKSNRKSTLIGTLMGKTVLVDEVRINEEARALLARSNPSEQARGEFKMDRTIGWAVLYWDIPTTTFLPFLLTNVWPENLRIPFHRAGSILYLGIDVSFAALRKGFIWAALAVMLILLMFNLRSVKSHAAQRFRAVMSRIFYGAMFTFVIFQAGSLVSIYKSCSSISDSNVTSVCALDPIDDGNATHFRIRETSFDSPTIFASFGAMIWAYFGAMHYTAYEKNAASPSFMWTPVYELIRWSVKAIIAGVTSVYKLYPKTTMPTCLLGYAYMFFLTYQYQPCQGQGRIANNLRATGFALGTYISLCGIICILSDLEPKLSDTAGLAIAYAILLTGTIATALCAWKLNDRRAKTVAIPDKPWHVLLSFHHETYVRMVAAEALLLHAENTSGKSEIAQELASVLSATRSLKIELPYVKLRTAAAYLVFASGEIKYDDARIATHRGVSNLPAYQAMDDEKMFHFFIRMFRCCQSKVSRIETHKRRRKKSSGGRHMRLASGTFKTASVNECLKDVVGALLSGDVEESLKARVAEGLCRIHGHLDEHSFFSIDSTNPLYIHALLKANYYNLLNFLQKKRDASTIKDSAIWIYNFCQNLKNSMHVIQGGAPITKLLAYFRDDDAFVVSMAASEIILKSSLTKQLLMSVILLFKISGAHDQDATTKPAGKSNHHAKSGAVMPMPSKQPADFEDKDELLELAILIVCEVMEMEKRHYEIMETKLGISGFGGIWYAALGKLGRAVFSGNYRIHRGATCAMNKLLSHYKFLSLNDVGTLGPYFVRLFSNMDKVKSKIRENCESLLSRIQEGQINMELNAIHFSADANFSQPFSQPKLIKQDKWTNNIIEIKNIALILSMREKSQVVRSITNNISPAYEWERIYVRHLAAFTTQLFTDYFKKSSRVCTEILVMEWNFLRFHKGGMRRNMVATFRSMALFANTTFIHPPPQDLETFQPDGLNNCSSRWQNQFMGLLDESLIGSSSSSSSVNAAYARLCDVREALDTISY